MTRGGYSHKQISINCNGKGIPARSAPSPCSATLGSPQPKKCRGQTAQQAGDVLMHPRDKPKPQAPAPARSVEINTQGSRLERYKSLQIYIQGDTFTYGTGATLGWRPPPTPLRPCPAKPNWKKGLQKSSPYSHRLPQGPAQAFALPSVHPAIGAGKKRPEKKPRAARARQEEPTAFCTPAEIRGAAEEREDVHTYRLGCNKNHKSYRELTHRSGVLGRKRAKASENEK